MPAAARKLSAREPSPRYLAYAGAVLVDSGPLIALFNGGDRWHAPVLRWLQANPQSTLVSTWCVATEVCALLARRIHNDCALDFLRWVQRGGLSLDRAIDGSLTEVLRINQSCLALPAFAATHPDRVPDAERFSRHRCSRLGRGPARLDEHAPGWRQRGALRQPEHRPKQR